MTNKVKPFFITITDDMTPQMVQDAFDKCRKLGVKDTELCDSLDYSHWVYFGVCGRDGLYYSDYHDNFHGDAQEITIDQLDEWLGLKSKAEWSGEGLPSVGIECEFKKYYQDKSELVKCFIVGETKDKEWLVVHDYADDGLHFANKRTGSFEFRPIESPEQKAERERLEAIDSMFIELNLDGERELNEGDRESIYWKSCEWAYDSGYRKQ